MTNTAMRVAATVLILSIVASAGWRIFTANAYGNWWATASIFHYGLGFAGAIVTGLLVVHGLRLLWRKGDKS